LFFTSDVKTNLMSLSSAFSTGAELDAAGAAVRADEVVAADEDDAPAGGLA
jgi:hypothetical protein